MLHNLETLTISPALFCLGFLLSFQFLFVFLFAICLYTYTLGLFSFYRQKSAAQFLILYIWFFFFYHYRTRRSWCETNKKLVKSIRFPYTRCSIPTNNNGMWMSVGFFFVFIYYASKRVIGLLYAKLTFAFNESKHTQSHGHT